VAVIELNVIVDELRRIEGVRAQRPHTWSVECLERLACSRDTNEGLDLFTSPVSGSLASCFSPRPILNE
jgi:hypothetical protein